MIAVAAAGVAVVFALVALAVPFVVYALSKRERIGDSDGDGDVDRSAAERWARRDGDEDRPDRR